MASPTLAVSIEANARDQATRTLRQVEKQLTKVRGDLSKNTTVQNRATVAVERARKEVDLFRASLVGMAAVVAGRTIGALHQSAKQAAQFTDQIRVMRDQVEDFDAILAESSERSRGLFSQAEIVQAAATFKQFGLDVSQLPRVLDLVGRTAIKTGKDMGHLLESLTEGVARGSLLRLDNLGIILSETQISASAAAKGIDKLTGAEKKAAQTADLLALSLDQLEKKAAGVTLADSASAKFRQMENTVADASNAFGQLWLQIEHAALTQTGLTVFLDKVSQGVNDTGAVAKATRDQLEELRATFVALPGPMQGLIDPLDDMIGKLDDAAEATRRLRVQQEFTRLSLKAAGSALLAQTVADLDKPKKKRSSRSKAPKSTHNADFERETEAQFQRDVLVRGLQAELQLLQAKTEVERQALGIQLALEQIRMQQASGLDPKVASLQAEIVLQTEANRVSQEALALEDAKTAARWASAEAGIQGFSMLAQGNDKATRAMAFVEGTFAAVKAAIAYAEGNIPQGIALTAAAAQAFSFAGKGGGGGGARGGSRSSAGAGPAPGATAGSPGASGPKQVIVQINGPMSKQDVARAMQEANQAMRGTGAQGAPL